MNNPMNNATNHRLVFMILDREGRFELQLDSSVEFTPDFLAHVQNHIALRLQVKGNHESLMAQIKADEEAIMSRIRKGASASKLLAGDDPTGGSGPAAETNKPVDLLKGL